MNTFNETLATKQQEHAVAAQVTRRVALGRMSAGALLAMGLWIRRLTNGEVR